MESSNRLEIVVGADDRFVRPLVVTLYSALTNVGSGTVVTLYIINGGISQKNQDRIRQVVAFGHIKLELIWLEPDLDQLSGLLTSTRMSIATYLRLLIPDLLPNDCAKVLYLDSDLVIEDDLRKLWLTSFNGKAVAASRCYYNPYVSSKGGLLLYRKHSIAEDTPYFNAGVLLINLDKWRRENVSGRVLAYLRDNSRFIRWWDQDGLNATLLDDWEMLEPRWNRMQALDFFERWPESSFKNEIALLRSSLNEDPGIVHFTGSYKPWSMRCDDSQKYRYYNYLRASGWCPTRFWLINYPFLFFVQEIVRLYLSTSHHIKDWIRQTWPYQYLLERPWYKRRLEFRKSNTSD